jgi:hypothetical protein
MNVAYARQRDIMMNRPEFSGVWKTRGDSQKHPSTG